MPQRWTRWHGHAAQGALVAVALLIARAEAPSPAANVPTFAIVSQSPVLELRFRGMALREARSDAKLNELALSFAQPVDGGLFDRLARAEPDWIDMAYGGYDNAVIRARHPVQFLTRAESDGFSLRFVTVQNDPKATPDGMQKIDAPFDGTNGAARASLLDGISQFFRRVF